VSFRLETAHATETSVWYDTCTYQDEDLSLTPEPSLRLNFVVNSNFAFIIEGTTAECLRVVTKALEQINDRMRYDEIKAKRIAAEDAMEAALDAELINVERDLDPEFEELVVDIPEAHPLDDTKYQDLVRVFDTTKVDLGCNDWHCTLCYDVKPDFQISEEITEGMVACPDKTCKLCHVPVLMVTPLRNGL